MKQPIWLALVLITTHFSYAADAAFANPGYASRFLREDCVSSKECKDQEQKLEKREFICTECEAFTRRYVKVCLIPSSGEEPKECKLVEQPFTRYCYSGTRVKEWGFFSRCKETLEECEQQLKSEYRCWH